MTIQTKNTPYDQILTISTEEGKILELSRSKNKNGKYSNICILGGTCTQSIIAFPEETLINLFDSGKESYTYFDNTLQETTQFLKKGSVWKITLTWEWEGEFDKEVCTITHADFVSLVRKFKRELNIKKYFEGKKNKTLIGKVVNGVKVMFTLPSKVFGI